MSKLYECVKRDITNGNDLILFHGVNKHGLFCEEFGVFKIEKFRSGLIVSADAIMVGMSYEFDEILDVLNKSKNK